MIPVDSEREAEMTVDTAIVNGRVFDGRMLTTSTAVGIGGGRIIRVGSDAHVRGLVHRGGLRADILSGGEIAAGDPIEPL